MANIEDVGKNTAKKIENTTAQQASSAASNAAHNLASSSSSDTNKNIRPKYRVSPGKEASINTINRPSNNTGDLSSDEEKEFKKQRDIENNAEALDTVADVAANSGNGVAKFFGNAHKVLAKNEGYRNATANAARVANKLAPGAQSMINKAVESGAADKVADAVSAKNGEADKAGEKKLDDSTKKEVKKAAKEAGDKGKSEHSVETEGMVIIKNPLTWIILAFVIVMTCLMMVLVPLLHTSISKRGGICKFPYVEMEHFETITVKDGDELFDVPLEDYVAGVIAHEVGDFYDSMEMLKVQAVAARTYAQVKMKQQGYVINSAVNQTYSPDEEYRTPGSPFYDAAQETAGIVMIQNVNGTPTFISTEYDALAIDESCGGKEDLDRGIVITCQQHIEIPIDWLKSKMIESDYNFFKRSFHGRGMSQWGAYYLAVEKGYDFERLLNMFYDGELVSLYPCFGNFDIRVTPDSATQLVHTSVEDFLKSKGKSIESVNDGLRDVVLQAGPGTRQGVVTAVTYLINTFLDYDIRLPYSYGGGWGGDCYFDCSTANFYGINPNWGSAINDVDANYNSLGMDCASFVTWAYHTGGLTFPTYVPQFASIDHVEYHDIEDVDEYKGQPGDFITHPGHVMLILDYYNEGGEEGYYIAEASGYKQDIRVIKQSIDQLSGKDNRIGDMTYYFENYKVSDYKKAFDEGRMD